MGFMGDRAFLIWSLAASGAGTTLTASGNSGGFASPPVQNKMSAVDLRWVDDLTIAVFVAGAVTGTTPSLTVQLGFFDDQGNLYQPTTLKTTAITATSNPTTAVFLAVGRHSGSAGTYIALPEWGNIAWTITGTTPVFNGVEIAVYGR